jgi:predicted esterase
MKGILTLILLVGSVVRLTAQEQPLAVGKVIDTVKCKANEKQSYALYLPKNYSRTATWPVIFFYDPGARGKVPVAMYSSLAEKYQCILVGSNNSRNGPLNATQEAEQAILKDVSGRLSIAQNKLLISGFSGGARASVFLSQQRKTYAGIIACGGAFPSNGKLTAKDKTPFVEIVGNVDFNYIEALETEYYLSDIEYPHALFLFQGTHTWPPVNVYDQAVFWHLFKIQPPLKSLVDSYETGLLANAEGEMNAGELCLAYWNLDQAVLASSKIELFKKRISTDPRFLVQQKKLEGALKTEKDFLREFYQLYARINYVTHDTTFKENDWRNLITRVNKLSKSDEMLDRQAHERLVQQIKIGCIGGYHGEVEFKRYLQASLKARILILLQPDYQSYVLLARAYAKMNRKKEALGALSKSAELGLSDRSAVEQSDFSSLVKEKKFVAVKQQVEANAKKSP